MEIMVTKFAHCFTTGGLLLVLLHYICHSCSAQAVEKPRCLSNVCLNGGTCFINKEARSFECVCLAGYGGTLCESTATLAPSSTELPSLPVTPTATENTNNNRASSISLSEQHQEEVGTTVGGGDPCRQVTCKNGGSCQASGDGVNYRCYCRLGYQGTHCERQKVENNKATTVKSTKVASMENRDDPCENIWCGRGMKCISRGRLYNCVPDDGDTSDDMVMKVTPQPVVIRQQQTPQHKSVDIYNEEQPEPSGCTGKPCFNGGTCNPAEGLHPMPFCSCVAGWTGERCEVDVDECGGADDDATTVCQNDGSCVNEAGGFKCLCPSGITGVHCETNIDDCASRPCQNGGSCNDMIADFECECAPGWSGKTCQEPHDPCGSQPCGDSGLCRVNSDGVGYSCTCSPGFTGPACTFDIDDCADVVCQNPSHSCVDLVNSYECRCADGTTGPNCDRNTDACSTSPCRNGGSCLASSTVAGKYVCQCPAGFEGRNCETDIDECAVRGRTACSRLGLCRNTPGSFECYCEPGFAGADCSVNVDDCLGGPCMNGGICVDSVNAFVCLCEAGTTGHRCQYQTDDDDGDAEVNGWNNNNNNNNSDDIIVAGGSGWTPSPSLRTTARPITCLSRKCLNGGTCHRVAGQFTCACLSDFSGLWCEIRNRSQPSSIATSLTTGASLGVRKAGTVVGAAREGEPVLPTRIPFPTPHSMPLDACADRPCKYNGTCVPISDGSYLCDCHPGYSGLNCEIDAGECISHPCANGGECFERSHPTSFTSGAISGEFAYSTAAGFECVCQPGYQGTTCAEAIQPEELNCASDPCRNGATCVDQNGSFRCECPLGYFGADCSEDIDECLMDDRLCGPNSVKCVNLIGSYRCQCSVGFGGQDCSVPLSGCADVDCGNNGTVCSPVYSTVTGIHGHVCSCPRGTGGTTCSQETTAGFAKNSQLAYVSSQLAVASASAVFELRLSLRTTLTDAVVVTGINVLFRPVFVLRLENGYPLVDLHGQGTLAPNMHGERINDGEWWTLTLKSVDGTLTFSVADESRSTVLASDTQLIHSPVQLLNTMFGGTGNGSFVGCIRDVSVNGRTILPQEFLETSVNVTLGCPRQEQCHVGSCSGHGRCVDLWDDHSCSCDRPYLPPSCEYALEEATFGKDGIPSYLKVDMAPVEAESVKRETNISMLLRTREPNGSVLFIGSMRPQHPEDDTFFAVLLINGQLALNAKLGGSGPMVTLVGGPRLDDGRVHDVRIERRDNRIAGGYVDGELVFSGEINRPFPYPLLVDRVYVGGMPAVGAAHLQRAKRQLASAPFSAGVPPFRGTIQDLRINGQSIAFWPVPSGVDSGSLLGKVSINENVLRGTVSEDACKSGPCQHGSKCTVTFNDFDCSCTRGWTGKTCERIDHCVKNVCPANTACFNHGDGYYCSGAASLTPTSSAVFQLSTARQGAPGSIIFYTVDLKLRTRSSDGLILTVLDEGSTDYFILDTHNGGLRLRYRLDGKEAVESNVTRAVDVSNGKMHHIKLTLLTDRSYVNVDNQSSAIYLTASHPRRPISDLFNSATTVLTVGFPSPDVMAKNPALFASDAKGIKGCLEDVTFGDLPALSLLSADSYAGGIESSAHFRPVSINRVQHDRCAGDPLCTWSESSNQIQNQIQNGTESDSADSGGPGPCLNGATCEDLWNLRQCHCKPGFTGPLCEVNIDDCVDNQCTGNGTCVDGVLSYGCECLRGYTGRFCETEIDECKAEPCLNEGRCTDLVGGYSCVCNANYTGHSCEILITVDCASDPCQNGASCEDVNAGPSDLKSFLCHCAPGYTGRACESEIDYCEARPCQNGGVCESLVEILGFSCACRPGYQGPACEVDVDECSSDPCMNGAVCTQGVNSFNCSCASGWHGDRCESDIDECVSNPCMNGATCLNEPGTYQCHCPTYYIGRHCEQPGSCLSNPCVNNADCDQVNATDHRCVCSVGYTGPACETEIDYCLSAPCLNNATCDRKLGGFLCQCPPGFRGDTCEIDIDDCASQPCVNNGVCKDAVDHFTCDCENTGFEGETCAVDINECSDAANCVHGICENRPGSFECRCHDGYLGARCQAADPCFPDVANNNATRHMCHRGQCVRARVQSSSDGKQVETVVYECECDPGFQGEFCTEPMGVVRRSRGPPLTYIVGPILLIIILLSVAGCLSFLLVARNKRASHGTYSPSRQEVTGARAVQMNPMIKPPPEERLI